MVVLSNIAYSKGFYDLLHLLHQRQRRLIRLMRSSFPVIHAIPKGLEIKNFACPLLIPMGLYKSADAVFTEEVWENQRNYPILGWSPRLMPSDPPPFSDFSGIRLLNKEEIHCPVGFQWKDDYWTVASHRLPTIPFDEKDDEGWKTGDQEEQQEHEGQEAAGQPVGKPGTLKKKEFDGFFDSSAGWSGPFRHEPFSGATLRRRVWIRRRNFVPCDKGRVKSYREEGQENGTVDDDDDNESHHGSSGGSCSLESFVDVDVEGVTSGVVAAPLVVEDNDAEM